MKNDWSDMPDEMLAEIEEIRESLEPNEKGQPKNTKEEANLLDSSRKLEDALKTLKKAIDEYYEETEPEKAEK